MWESSVTVKRHGLKLTCIYGRLIEILFQEQANSDEPTDAPLAQRAQTDPCLGPKVLILKCVSFWTTQRNIEILKKVILTYQQHEHLWLMALVFAGQWSKFAPLRLFMQKFDDAVRCLSRAKLKIANCNQQTSGKANPQTHCTLTKVKMKQSIISHQHRCFLGNPWGVARQACVFSWSYPQNLTMRESLPVLYQTCTGVKRWFRCENCQCVNKTLFICICRTNKPS